MRDIVVGVSVANQWLASIIGFLRGSPREGWLSWFKALDSKSNVG